jgi:hypothetical protein
MCNDFCIFNLLFDSSFPGMNPAPAIRCDRTIAIRNSHATRSSAAISQLGYRFHNLAQQNATPVAKRDNPIPQGCR